CLAGAGVGPTDSVDGRSPDRRWLSQDRDHDQRRHRPGGAARTRRYDFVCGVLPTRSDGRVDRAGARADDRRGGGRIMSEPGDGFGQMLRAAFGDRVQQDVPLAPLTTFRVGGPADWLIETRGSGEIVTALTLAHRAQVPVTVLGGGSNVLVSDSGVRGLVVRPRAGEIRQVDDRHVRADAAISINGLVRWTINHRRAGLEAWAGTPGTVGGGIFGNAHFGGRLIGDLVTEVRLAARDGTMSDVPGAAMAFGYDRSRLQRTGEVLLSAVFAVSAGDPAALRSTARESLAYRKRTQPLETPRARCVFRNP